MVNQLTTAVHQGSNTHNASHSAEHHADPSRLDRLMKLSGLSNITKDKLTGENSQPEQLYEEGDGELDIVVAEKMLKWHAEAVGRMVELSAPSDV